MKLKKLIFLIFTLTVYQVSFSQWDLSPLVKSAIDGIKEGYDKLQKIEKVADDLKNHQEVKAFSKDWLKLSDDYKKAAELMRKAPLPTDFDADKYNVPFTKVNCDTKDNILSKCNEFLHFLNQGQKNSYYFQNRLSYIGQEIDFSMSIIDKLIKLHEQLMGSTTFNQTIALNWYDLERHVKPALVELKDATAKQQIKLKREYDLTRLKISNLSYNLSRINQLNCDLNFSSLPLKTKEFNAAGTGFCTSINQIQYDIRNFRINKDMRLLSLEKFDANWLFIKEITPCNKSVTAISFTIDNYVINGNNVYVSFVGKNNNKASFKGSFTDTFLSGTINFFRSENSQTIYNVSESIVLSRVR